MSNKSFFLIMSLFSFSFAIPVAESDTKPNSTKSDSESFAKSTTDESKNDTKTFMLGPVHSNPSLLPPPWTSKPTLPVVNKSITYVVSQQVIHKPVLSERIEIIRRPSVTGEVVEVAAVHKPIVSELQQVIKHPTYIIEHEPSDTAKVLQIPSHLEPAIPMNHGLGCKPSYGIESSGYKPSYSGYKPSYGSLSGINSTYGIGSGIVGLGSSQGLGSGYGSSYGLGSGYGSSYGLGSGYGSSYDNLTYSVYSSSYGNYPFFIPRTKPDEQTSKLNDFLTKNPSVKPQFDALYQKFIDAVNSRAVEEKLPSGTKGVSSTEDVKMNVQAKPVASMSEDTQVKQVMDIVKSASSSMLKKLEAIIKGQQVEIENQVAKSGNIPSSDDSPAKVTPS